MGLTCAQPCRTVTSLFRTNPAGFLTHRKSPFLWSIGPLQAIKLNQSHGIVLGEFVGMQDGYGDQVEESSSDNEPGPSSSASVSMPISSRVAPRWASATESSTSFQPAMFTLPHRSIFSSGLPTSSISANTAQASMSSPSSLYPLSTLSSSNANRARRAARETPQAIIHRRSRSTQIQKYADDHSTSVEDGSVMRRHGIRPTSMAVSNLFATTNPNASRPPSFAESSTVSHYVRSKLNEPLNDYKLTVQSGCGFYRGLARSSLYAWLDEWKTLGYHSTLLWNVLCVT